MRRHRLINTCVSVSQRIFGRDIIVPFIVFLFERFGVPAHLNGVELDISSPLIDMQTKRGILLGNYESPEANLIDRYLDPSLDVIELGGGIGYIACYVDNKLEREASQLTIEPNETLIKVIRTNRARTDADFKTCYLAYHPVQETVEFFQHEHTFSGTTTPQHERDYEATKQVAATSLDSLRSSLDGNRFTLIADIEGAEHALLSEEMSTLRSHCMWMIMELHSTPEDDISDAIELLDASPFSMEDRREDVFVFRNTNLTEYKG